MAYKNSFEYVVGQILSQRCVPVAGAGVSISSIHPDGLAIQNVKHMVITLKTAILKMRVARYNENVHGPICMHGNDCASELAYNYQISSVKTIDTGCFFCDVISAAKNQKLGNLAELFLWELI